MQTERDSPAMRNAKKAGSPADRAAAPLARLQTARMRRGVYTQPASHTDIHALHEMLIQRLDLSIASAETACRVQEASPNSIWSVYSAIGLVGGIAFLPLNPLGLYNLIYGKFDFANPPLDALAVRSERPSVLYVWALLAKGSGIVGLVDVLRHLDSQRFRGVDIWAHAITTKGEKIAGKLGLEPVPAAGANYFKYTRSAV